MRLRSRNHATGGCGIMRAMAVLNSRQGAALIEATTGRQCSRQNLEKLCHRGRLARSVVSVSPLRLDGDLLVAEYLANVDPMQVGAVNHGPAKARGGPATPRPRPAPVAAPAPAAVATRLVGDGDGELPDYNVSRARTEYEKANLLELDRKTKEGLLLPREQVERVWANAITIARTKLLGVPTRVRQRFPHLTLEEVATMEELIREALEELAGGGSDGE